MQEALLAVLCHSGGVLTASPCDSFSTFETVRLPDGLIRRLTSTDPDTVGFPLRD